MKYFLLGLLVIALLAIGIVIFYSVKFRNPYKLYMCFGKKGAGKSTYMVKLTSIYRKKGWKVFATNPIPGAYLLDPADIGKFQFPENSVILIDEVGMVWDNRSYRDFKPSVRNWFKLQRHYKCCVYLFSQTWDIDIKLRNLTDKLYLMINYGNCLTVCKEIKRKITVVKPSENAESRIADELIISPFFLAPFGARHYVWIPKWSKYFDSFAAPSLDRKEWQLINLPDGRSPFSVPPSARVSRRESPKRTRTRNSSFRRKLPRATIKFFAVLTLLLSRLRSRQKD